MAIEGNRIRLREQRITDLPMMVELKNNLDTQAWNQRLAPDLTLEMVTKNYNNRPASNSKTPAIMIIENKDKEESIGFVSYYGLRPRFSAAIGLALRKQYFGKGYGFEASDLLMEFLFHEMGVKTLYWYTTSFNQGSIKLGKKLGFKEAIRSRETTFIGGKFHDGLVLDILREEFYERRTDLTDNIEKL